MRLVFLLFALFSISFASRHFREYPEEQRRVEAQKRQENKEEPDTLNWQQTPQEQCQAEESTVTSEKIEEVITREKRGKIDFNNVSFQFSLNQTNLPKTQHLIMLGIIVFIALSTLFTLRKFAKQKQDDTEDIPQNTQEQQKDQKEEEEASNSHVLFTILFVLIFRIEKERERACHRRTNIIIIFLLRFGFRS